MIRGVYEFRRTPEFFSLLGALEVVEVLLLYQFTRSPHQLTTCIPEIYSVRKDLTGLTDAALNDWKLTVINAISSALTPAIIKIEKPMGVL